VKPENATSRQFADVVRDRACLSPSNTPSEQGLYVTPVFGAHLSGLCDGEGHFGIQAAASAYKCFFVIGLRADDVALLEQLRDVTGLGTVRIHRPTNTTRNNRPSARWRISAKAECLALTRILDEYPLWSKKAAEYVLWREAVHEWQTLTQNGRRRLDWSQMEAYATGLLRERAYQA
jgi:hypothetical protein